MPKSTNFRLLLAGATLSQFGDVAFMVALPWLVLQLTGSGVALGAILLTLAIPRAALMLVGGAVSDRLPARGLLIAANVALFACVSLTALLAWQHLIALWMLFVVAIVFGIADAFALPALKVLVPAIVEREQIATANALLQSTSQICLLAGGAIAGVLIARTGLVAAFAVDAVSFVFLIAALLLIRVPAGLRVQTSSLVRSILDGVAYALADPTIRALLVVIAGVNFCLTGATQVGIAALVYARFGSAAYFGTLVTASAVGSLLGFLIAGAWRRSDLTSTLLVAAALLGAGIASFALPLPIVALIAVLVLCGIIAGYVNVTIISSLQRSVDPQMLGRVMSIVVFSSIGVAPLSLAISGFIAQTNIAALFACAGGTLIVIAIIGLLADQSARTSSRSARLRRRDAEASGSVRISHANPNVDVSTELSEQLR
jgi:MFS family permease